MTTTPTYLTDLRLTPRHWYIELVASMEQITGAALSTIVGIIIPLLNLMLHPTLSTTMQGLMGATGLVGIAIGSAVIGPLSDRQGYLRWFRICAVLVIAGAAVAAITPSPWLIIAGLFIAGFGTGGGYSLDAAYISELMPARWSGFMVGVAKAGSAIGFILPAVAAVIILHNNPSPHTWRSIIWVMGGLGVLTLLMRLRWAESPRWLLSRGQTQKAIKAATFFFGPGVTVRPPAPVKSGNSPKAPATSLFKGRNLLRVVYSGIPWACEGLGVYGIGVFLPVLIMALGIDSTHATGIPGIINSVELTALINFCILPGFIIGLVVVRRIRHSTMLWTGFVGSAAGMAVLLAAYLLHWPVWVSIASFMFFEVALNAGPHLITYIIPTVIFPVDIRGAGTGIASFLGKVGAVLGVFFMPALLHAGGMPLVLTVTIAVMLLGALISFVCSRLLDL